MASAWVPGSTTLTDVATSPGARRAQARDILFYAHSTARFLVDVPGAREDSAAGGYGVLVGPPRDTHARFRLPGVEGVLTWLEASL